MVTKKHEGFSFLGTSHAMERAMQMIATGLTNNERFLQCKNSFRNDPTEINGNDIEICHISLDPSDTSSEWTLFYEDEDGKSCLYYILLDL